MISDMHVWGGEVMGKSEMVGLDLKRREVGINGFGT